MDQHPHVSVNDYYNAMHKAEAREQGRRAGEGTMSRKARKWLIGAGALAFLLGSTLAWSQEPTVRVRGT